MGDQLTSLRVVDPVLTNLARGYSNAESVIDVAFPIVGGLSKEAGVFPKFGKEAFRVYQTERAIRAGSNRIPPAGVTPGKYAMTEHDLEYPIDYREEDEAIFPYEQFATNITTSGILLRREKIGADLIQDTSQYAAGSKVALAGDDCFSEPGSDPVGVVTDGKEAMRKLIVKEPNQMIIGPSTLVAWKKHPQFLGRISANQNKVVTLQIIKEVLEFENIVVGKMIWIDDAGVTHDIWGDMVFMGYIPGAVTGQERTMYEPSFGYTFRKKDQPVVDKRPESGGKLRIIRSTDMFDINIAGNDAGYLITNTIK